MNIFKKLFSREPLRAYIRIRQMNNGRWLAWGSEAPLKANDPIEEDGEQEVWFDFGETREVAEKRLIEELKYVCGSELFHIEIIQGSAWKPV